MISSRPIILRKLYNGMTIGIGVSLMLIVMLVGGFLKTMQLSISNIYYVGAPTSDRIVIVALDDASLSAYGRSPSTWSRSLYADLILVLNDANARVVAFDLIFSESEPEDEAILEAVETARQGSQRTRFVMATAGTETLPVQSTLDDHPYGIRINTVLQPNDVLRNATDYIGFVNSFPDVDSAIRRQPSVIDFDGDLTLSFSLTTYLAYLRIPQSAFPQLITSGDGTIFATPQRRIPVDDFGFWLNDFFSIAGRPENASFPTVSFRDVLEGTVDPSIFEDKIVLVGLINNVGATDRYLVPSSSDGQPMAGVEIHANAIESLLQDRVLVEQSRSSELLMIIIMTIGISVIAIYPRWYFKIVLWAVFIFVATLISSFLFSQTQVIINLLYLWLALSLPVLLLVGVEITQEINRRRHSEFLLESVTQVEQQRLLLDKIWPLIARDIQEIIPDAKGAIMRVEDGQSVIIESIGKTPKDFRHIALEAYQTSKTIQQGDSYAVPIIWQDNIYGIITLETLRHQAFVRTMIEDLARRIAPGIENAILYKETHQQREIQAAIFDNIPEAIIVINEQLHAVQWNTAFENLWGMSVEVGQEFIDILQANSISEQAVDELKRRFANGANIRYELGISGKTFNLTAAPMAGATGWVVILADVTQISELSQLKTQMIRMASHDLKNPLSRVIGYADLILMNDSVTDRNRQFVGYISSAGNEMLEIITEILDLEQLRSKESPKEALDFARLVKEVYARFEPDFTRKSQAHELTIEQSPIMVNGTYQQLSQVVANLLSNANKYTPDNGSVRVNITVNDAKILMSIQDTGYGIPDEAQSKLFTEFYRVQNHQTAHISGTGLGLSIVKFVLEAHDGRIWVQSREGQGSTFFVELPSM